MDNLTTLSLKANQVVVDKLASNLHTLEGLVEGLDVGDIYANVVAIRSNVADTYAAVQVNQVKIDQIISSNVNDLLNKHNEQDVAIGALGTRMTAAEAKNQEQDSILGVNGDNIAVLQGNVTTLFSDLSAVNAAVGVLQTLSAANGSNIASIQSALSALQDASVSNAATITSIQTAIDDLTANKANLSNVQAAEAAIVVLEGLVGGVQVTTLAPLANPTFTGTATASNVHLPSNGLFKIGAAELNEQDLTALLNMVYNGNPPGSDP